ncbi:MAG: hypothetical protein CM1200mP30_11170 [Pseudomonadota bacterium]|nr:MAG: hypothetical protein CM1200mP30_11170 [Pseudomonadota bacterium]
MKNGSLNLGCISKPIMSIKSMKGENMKKAISLLMTAVLFAAFNISAMGKSISVGYVFGRAKKKMVAGQCDIMMDFNP